MATIFEIPLKPSTPTIMNIVLGANEYNLRFTYNKARDGAWILDIADASFNLLLAGLPLVSGDDLFAPYRYLGFSGSMIVTTDRGTGEVPGFDDFGATAHLFFVPDAA